MKLMRYSRKREPSALSRLGVLVGHDLVADLQAGYALYLVDEMGNRKGTDVARLYMPPYLAQFLHIGEPAWLALGDAYTYLADLAETSPDAIGLGGEPLFLPLSDCRLYSPVRTVTGRASLLSTIHLVISSMDMHILGTLSGLAN